MTSTHRLNQVKKSTMKVISHLLVGLCLTLYTCKEANTTSKEVEPTNLNNKHHAHDRIGLHGMVLVTDGIDLFASHLPLYRAPHDYQLVYIVESKYKSKVIKQLLSASRNTASYDAAKSVTILPASFDLNKLINGKSFEIEAQMYIGHFERGGKKWLLDNKFSFVRQVHKRPLTGLQVDKSLSYSAWKVIEKPSTVNQLFIHNIASAPSFDAIVVGEGCSVEYGLKLSLPSRVPDVLQVTKAIKECDTSEVLYFETRDFQQ